MRFLIFPLVIFLSALSLIHGVHAAGQPKRRPPFFRYPAKIVHVPGDGYNMLQLVDEKGKLWDGDEQSKERLGMGGYSIGSRVTFVKQRTVSLRTAHDVRKLWSEGVVVGVEGSKVTLQDSEASEHIVCGNPAIVTTLGLTQGSRVKFMRQGTERGDVAVSVTKVKT